MGFQLLPSYITQNKKVDNMKTNKYPCLINRRALMVGALASLITSPASAYIGLSAGPDLFEAFKSLPSIREGTSNKVIYILTSPWCPRTPEIYAATRGLVSSGAITLAWIPISGGQPEGSNAVEELLSRKIGIADMFNPINSGTVKGNTPLSDRQDYLVANNLERLLIRDTGAGIRTPTIAYSIGSQIRIIPGSLRREQLEIIADFAT